MPGIKTKYINYDIKYASLLGVRKIFCYNPETGTGYYLKKSRIKAWKCRRKFIRLRNYVEKNFTQIVEKWRKGFKELVGLDHWIRVLDLDPDNYEIRDEKIKVPSYELAPLTYKRDGSFIRSIKHTFPWYSRFGKYLRNHFLNAPHFTVRSDIKMHCQFFKRKLLSIFGLSALNKNMREIKKFKNIHKGERCFITCTGPSLTIEDLESLENEYTFGVNSITKAYPLTDWRPTYYVLIDAYAYGETLKDTDVCGEKFCKDSAFLHYRSNPKTRTGNEYFIPINYSNHWNGRMKKGKIKISKNIAVGVYDCFTVTNMAIQIAAYMGFKDIYIIGADATYKLEKTHFIEGEFTKKLKEALL